jgi:KDO2-lipid IV(A) lauroyltransferase
MAPRHRKTSMSPAQRAMWRMSRRLKNAEYWLTGQMALGALKVLRLLPPDRALDFAERVARRFGPWFGRHRVAVANLRGAYPDKTPEQIEAIASDMWANMARLAVEYIFLDQLFDFDPENPHGGRVEVVGVDIFKRVRAEARPHVFFTAHLGNFEFLPIAAARFDLAISALFRAPNNPYIAQHIFSMRSSSMGNLVASRPGAALELARILDANGNVGALVDQHFRRGIPTTFFGRECTTSPLVPKLVRQYDCDLYPARCIRLPGGRFRLEVEEKLDLPRLESGQVDVPGLTQMLNDVVERWVREDPGQWMWFHKRWKR